MIQQRALVKFEIRDGLGKLVAKPGDTVNLSQRDQVRGTVRIEIDGLEFTVSPLSVCILPLSVKPITMNDISFIKETQHDFYGRFRVDLNDLVQ